MARRATPVTKGRATPKTKSAPDSATAKVATSARRGAKAKPLDEAPVDSLGEAVDSNAAPEAVPESAAAAPKTRRGRKAAPAVVDDHAATGDSGTVEAEASEPAPTVESPKPAPARRMTRRNREPEASAPPPLDSADEPAPEPQEPHAASAVAFHAESGTMTFDWPAIEQVAASEGPNQPMAKLLLAARAEGARSRWPF